MDFLSAYLIHLADDSLILGHRNSEWTGHGPILEQDIALSNISLDLIGQARLFYQYAATLLNLEYGVDTYTEDSLAYFRDAPDFKNCQLTEQSNGDWGKTILRQFLFSAYQQKLLNLLQQSPDEMLAAIAAKAIKEVDYHLRWSSEWVVRLGDGTRESHARMQSALTALAPFVPELFQPAGYEQQMIDEMLIPDIIGIRAGYYSSVNKLLERADLPALATENESSPDGKNGHHTVELSQLLEEMQSMQRTYPGCNW